MFEGQINLKFLKKFCLPLRCRHGKFHDILITLSYVIKGNSFICVYISNEKCIAHLRGIMKKYEALPLGTN